MIKLVTPVKFHDYELIDTGNYEKLERFGKYIISRPEPQALWDKVLPETEWQKLAHAFFKREKGSESYNADINERGRWILKKGMPEQWYITYEYKTMKLKMRLGLTAFKHVGIFPEQADNWNYIYDKIQSFNEDNINVLNLFAYTGGASIAARAAGASVTHVDSVKQVINWSNENMTASKLDNIRWIVDDVMKFVRREINRKSKFNGIILDPPSYGRGTKGEKWILEKYINILMKNCSQILKEQNIFIVLNLYSMGFSALIAENLIKLICGNNINPEICELYFPDRAGRKLPLGIVARFSVN